MDNKLYKQDITDCFASKIGGKGINALAFNAAIGKAKIARGSLSKYEGGKAASIIEKVKYNDIPALENIANGIRREFSSLVVIGTGGSTLNPQSIVALKHNLNPDFKIYFSDNLDPFYTEALFNGIDIAKTAFLATSKSGNTIEVLAHTLLAISKLEREGIKDIGCRFLIITDPVASTLRDIGNAIGATFLEHEPDIGGRFSTFTNVGLLPALVSGLDVRAFCLGAQTVIDGFMQNELSYPLEGASLAYCAIKSDLKINVFMPYFEALKPFTSWVCQIWAESLGKSGHGSTPVRAAGTLDQHSQLQLYLDGPADKLFNIIGIETTKIGPQINSHFTKLAEISYLEGKHFGEINKAAQSGTAATISANGRPVRLISLEKLNEGSLGALMMHFILETILTAQMLGINAFDQPAVEEGKKLTRKILGSQEK